ncbi:RNA polymerase I enhancer binding protein [Curvularia kusanoi]|uniref:RNA polymerase I enhancer binding protein n=1 Tax=Curvularia kusanoi TaxID=90978 RepID=A0A9P4T2R8_CURKU|nr:RNA polymerase I enhancer binding protein [Curvularia kusanoi]
MDDEAASQQLMSEARATPHLNDIDGSAIPLSLDGASYDLLSASQGSHGTKAKKHKKQHLTSSQGPRSFRSSPLPVYSVDDLQAAAVGTPSKSQAYLSTAPPPQTKRSNSQNHVGAAHLLGRRPSRAPGAADRGALETQPTQNKKRSQTAAGLDNAVAKMSPVQGGVTGEAMSQASQSDRKRRRKEKHRNSQQSAEHTRVSETPVATQEVPSRAAAGEGTDKRNGAKDKLASHPSDLPQSLNLEKPQESQSEEKLPLLACAQVDTGESESQHVHSKVDLPIALNLAASTEAASTSRSAGKQVKSEEQEQSTSQIKPAAASSTSKRGDKSAGKKKSSRKAKVRYSIGGVPGKLRISTADPKKTYKRGDDDNDRSAADAALEDEHQLGHPPDKRTGGEYTADEKELLRRAIRDHQERNGFDTAYLVEMIHSSNRTNVSVVGHTTAQDEVQFQKDCKAFWDDIQNAGLLRKMRDIKRHVQSRYHLFQRGHWSQEEDEQLRELHNLYPGQWKFIATQLNRLEKDVFNHWRDYVRHGENRVTKRWTTDEEENLVKALSAVCQKIEDYRAETGQPPAEDYYPLINWHEVCNRLGDTRSRLQCQSKWKLMCARDWPPLLDIETKPRGVPAFNETKTEPASSRKPSSKSTAKKDRKFGGLVATPQLPGPEDMLWGDKVDLFSYLVEQRQTRELVWIEDVDWFDIVERMGPLWSADTLQKAYEQLCELVLGEATVDLSYALSNVINYMQAHVNSDQQEERYQPTMLIGLNGTNATQGSVSQKRKRQSGASSGKTAVEKHGKTPGSSKVFKSEELIVDSEPEL